MTHILMLAAENGALPGGKVGGIGDVVRDVPRALATRDCQVTVLTPSYGSFNKLPGAKRKKSLKITFAGEDQTIKLYRLSQASDDPRVNHYVVDHPLFSLCGKGKIYCDDPPDRPFSRDASKFALFCAAAAEAINVSAFGDLDVLHLHDWHAAFLLILRHYAADDQPLKKLRCAYTIHNLALQGIRPFEGDESSLETWFPDLNYDAALLADPRWTNCVNPMASAIRLADAVHAVSPSYAKEILSPSDVANGSYGGEGLQDDLTTANRENRLFGILNGCEYPAHDTEQTPAHPDQADQWSDLIDHMQQTTLLWASRQTHLRSAHFIAFHALQKLPPKRPKMLITSVGRITDQKVALLRQATSSGKPALHATLDALGDYATLLLIGSGDSDCEQFLCETAARYANFIFLCGYSEALGDALYQQGDLFFMPSSFEPCGISQMLALRAGQLCLVHKVGGLKDTIIDNKTGYVFSGNNLTEQADAMIVAVERAMTQHQKKSAKWKNMRQAAMATRFEWDASIDAYLKKLYSVS